MKNKNGFTLAELLIVVAIIAVLVAISIPVFTSQLEKSREATDMANIRSAIAEVTAAVLTESYADYEPGMDDDIGNGCYYEDGYVGKMIQNVQTQDGWQSSTPDFGSKVKLLGTPYGGGFYTVEYYFTDSYSDSGYDEGVITVSFNP